ncbi:MAG: arginase [Legionellaceae bacterium]|nr:arginase [Legionellaceae bacterium]
MKNLQKRVINLVGYASGIAANNIDCSLGPWYFYYHQHLFQNLDLDVEWKTIVEATSVGRGMDVMPLVIEIVTKLGNAVLPLAKSAEPFCVIGGDHSSAIGTWSAVAHANRSKGDIGLVWIDAHMDCHTPHTSETKNIHGMPLAHLLGEGSTEFINLFEEIPALKPENVCLVGIRSYESGEQKTLEKLGVNVFYMDDVKKHGVTNVLAKAYSLVSKSTCGVGISLDLDGIDPSDAPGVGCPEPGGIDGLELVQGLKAMVSDVDILGMEIVEYNPIEDINGKTVKLALELFNAVYG